MTERHISPAVALLSWSLLSLGGCAEMTAALGLGRPPVEPTKIGQGPVVRDVVLTPPKDQPAPAPVQRRFDAIFLENRFLTVTVVPELDGRVTNVVFKPTGRELFYVGPVEYSGNVFRAGGANMGGIEVNHPYLHNGNAYCNEWLYTTETRPDGTAAVTMAFTSYPLLQRTVLTVGLAPNETVLRLTYRFENLAPYAVGFNPWINAVCRPDGDAQVVLPCDWITDHWFGANTEERFHQLYPWPVDKDGVDRSRLNNITDGLTAFAYGVTEGYAGVYYHKDDAGFARAFDPREMRGAKAWVGKKGWPWFELWAAVEQNMEAPGWLAAHETAQVSDAWFPVQGVGGMTWACEQGAVNFCRRGDAGLEVGVCPTSDLGPCAVRVIADGQVLLDEACPLDPAHPFHRTVEGAAGADEARLEVVAGSGRVVMRRQINLAPHPRSQFALPDKPWFRRNPLAEARWHESFSPLCNWGPWWPPVQSYEKVLKDDPASREAKIGLARALLKAYDSALADLPDGGRQTAPADPALASRAAGTLKELAAAQEPELETLCLLGLARMRCGEDAAAADTLRQVTARRPAHPPARFNLALLAARKQRWDEVCEEARAAVAAAPDSTLARQLLAVGLLHTGKAVQVEGVLAPALEANPAEVGTIELLRRAAEATEHAAAARKLAATVERLRKTAWRQAQAGLAQIADLENGREINPRAVDTLSGPPLPGREP